MLSVKDFEETTEARTGEFEHLEPGLHWCVITKATDHPSDDYVEIELEIDNPKDKFYRFFEGIGRPCRWRRYYTDKARPFFKGFVTAIAKCNKGYKYDGDENKFVGKHLYILFREQEYINKFGDVAVATVPWEAHSIEKAKDVKVLPIQTLEEQGKKRPAGEDRNTTVKTEVSEGVDISDDDLPF